MYNETALTQSPSPGWELTNYYVKGFLDYVHWWKILSYKKAHTCDLRLVQYLFHRESKILNEVSTLRGWPHSANHLVQSKNVCLEASD